MRRRGRRSRSHRFKALSRMSSSPTSGRGLTADAEGASFQSAVAHELFSDRCGGSSRSGAQESFKALSRMSSSPTRRATTSSASTVLFQSAVAHELFSDTVWNMDNPMSL